MNKFQMKHSQARDITRKALGLAIVNNRDKIIALLKKYGIGVDKSYTNDELIVGTLTALQSNDRFKKDLRDLLSKTTAEKISSFTGENNMEFFPYDGDVTDIPAPTGTSTTTTPKTKTALGSLLSNKDTLNSILGTGLNVLSTSLTNKSNQKLANTALAIETEKTKQAALAASGGGAAGGAGSKSGLSTGAKIGIGLGVAAIVGLVVYLIVKK